MTLEIRLAEHQAELPEGQPWPRPYRGYRPGDNPETVWAINRGVWRLDAQRALAEDEVVFTSPGGLVVCVATVEGLNKHGDRLALIGKPRPHDPRIGKTNPYQSASRNPVSYRDDGRAR